ncbi:hypothetical protein BVRB_9g206500 [Beta vulgaris subsp. vulgaris]|uniref:Endonuclease/exonuclease/phosphatase domain-containing protein n=1 Tax=Beta vulgaris subsp. vulgaris TaxID=3555 RepID=A0A0J8BQP4_BETVV|nr:hypothetical protein BVRB_9g206500 [Beta vulgaris subsp. vulgaris]
MQLREEQEEAWLCGGDFNLMMMSHEKQGCSNFCIENAEMLRQAARFCNFEDLGYMGHDFT